MTPGVSARGSEESRDREPVWPRNRETAFLACFYCNTHNLTGPLWSGHGDRERWNDICLSYPNGQLQKEDSNAAADTPHFSLRYSMVRNCLADKHGQWV